jgi:hypothetical protein
MRRAALIALAVLAGCAQPQPMTFDKSGATQQDYARDHDECSKNTRQVLVVINGGYNRTIADQFFVTCMDERGWTHSAKGYAPIF